MSQSRDLDDESIHFRSGLPAPAVVAEVEETTSASLRILSMMPGLSCATYCCSHGSAWFHDFRLPSANEAAMQRNWNLSCRLVGLTRRLMPFSWCKITPRGWWCVAQVNKYRRQGFMAPERSPEEEHWG